MRHRREYERALELRYRRTKATPAPGSGIQPPNTILGASLVAWWTADRADLVTRSGSAVTNWLDVVAGYDAAQGTGSAQPSYSATSFGGAPGITFDGTDDELTCTTAGLLTAMPDGAEPGEIWVIFQQDALVADNSTRVVANYGGASGTSQRRLQRVVSGGVNRAQALVGNGSTSPTISDTGVDLSTRHVGRVKVTATGVSLAVDGGVLSSEAASVPATSNSRLRIGASANTAASGFWNGKVRDVLVMLPPTDAQVAALTAWATPRRML